MMNDLLRRLRSPLAPIVYLLFPFIFSGLIALAFGGGAGGDQIPRFKVALVNEDDGFVGGFVMGAFGQEQVAQYFETTEVTREEAETFLRKSKVSGAIIIPKGFSDDIFDGRPTKLEVIKNPAEAIGPQAVEEAARMIAQLLDGATTILAEPLGMIRGGVNEANAADAEWSGFLDNELMAATATSMNNSLRSIRRLAFPPVIRLETTKDSLLAGGAQPSEANADTASNADAGEEEDNDDSGFLMVFRYVLPGMATFALAILALGFMADIPRERTMGTLARQLTLPIRGWSVVAGKMLSTMVMGLLVATAMAVVGALLLKARADLPAFALLCVAFLAAVTGLLSLVFGAARSEQQGGTVASIIVMMMAFLGGSWIPLDMLPAFLRNLSVLSLNYWSSEGFKTLLFSDAGIASIATELLVLGGIGLLSVVLGGWALQRRMMQGN